MPPFRVVHIENARIAVNVGVMVCEGRGDLDFGVGRVVSKVAAFPGDKRERQEAATFVLALGEAGFPVCGRRRCRSEPAGGNS